jgi:glyoxylase-like metal-dependent hydrolase (beta-lactamase superfamily II)
VERWRIGDVVVTRVEEFAMTATPRRWLAVLIGASVEEVREVGWLKPTYSTPDDRVTTSIGAYLVETPTKRLLVDAGVGNGKTRAAPFFDRLDTDFLQRVEECGWLPADVQGVVCTHMHSDHVGWNTTLVDGEWVPTFPNAEYYFVREEFDHWKRYYEGALDPDEYTDVARDMIDGKAVFADSVRPIADAGLVTWVGPDARIAPEVSLLPTPGHTPGHVSVVIESRGERAIITGDLMHFPCQIARPDWSAHLDTDPRASAETRRKFLSDCADTATLVLGTHFSAPSGGLVIRDGESFRFEPRREVQIRIT